MKKHRKTLIKWLFKHSQRAYIELFKNHQSWKIDRSRLLKYPKGTLGFELGSFLVQNGFQLLPKVERHDAYHMLTGYGTKVEDEIALQYLCYGNGKRSPYLLGAILLGTLLLPDYHRYYSDSFKNGKSLPPFHQLNYEKLLLVPLSQLRIAFWGNPSALTFNHIKS